MTFTIHRDPRHNCHFVNLAAMLKREDIEISRIYTQTGLFYKDDSRTTGNSTFFILSPYFRELYAHIRSRFGIIWTEKNIADTPAYVEEIRRILGQGSKSVGVTGDVFELPYCPYYQNSNALHEFEVIGYENGEFEVCDHYYQYHGFIKEADLQGIFTRSLPSLSLESLRLYAIRTAADYISLSPSQEWKRIVAENCSAMDGRLPYEFSQPVSGGTCGLSAFPDLRRKLNEIFTLSPQEADPVLEHLYQQVREVGNSRYHFGTYLKRRGEQEAIRRVFEAEQSWMIAANLLIRASLTFDFAHLGPRIIARIDQAEQAETESLAFFKNLLEQLD
ncbi:hypothetical protein [Paenibacillus chitinolyticus]|uniref:hypothetical protein n=1 Tax=Paenibacillus chitinolyticus TaxID=79263 RepID=UPI0036650A3C